MSNTCPVCQSDNEKVRNAPGGKDAYVVDCKYCGKYEISGTASAVDLTNYAPRWKISAAIRNKFENGETVILDTGNIKTIVDSTFYPEDPFDFIDKLLEYVYEKTGKVGKTVALNSYDFPVICAESEEQFKYIISKALDLELIEKTNDRYRLSLNGWKRISELKKLKTDSKKAFVAMWFNPELDEIWEQGIKPALEETGFQPIRIDLEEHNEKICDKIIAEIKTSGLLVADFTGQRGGVYFEAGFALGLGIPVIWTCSKNDIGNLHFDTRQYNHIVWETAEELREKLKNRIMATVFQIKNS